MARWWRGWRKRKQRRRAGSSVETDRQSLERAFRRLGAIVESAGCSRPLGRCANRWSSDAGARDALTASVNRLLVPGFAAHTLAQEERRWSTLEHTTPCSSFSAERVLGSLLHPAEPPGV